MRFIYLLPLFFFFFPNWQSNLSRKNSFFSFLFSSSSFGVLVESPSPHCNILYEPHHLSNSSFCKKKESCTAGQGAGCPQGVPSAPWLGCSSDLSSVHCRVSVYSCCVDVKSQPVPMDTVECRERRAASLLYLHLGFYIPQILGCGGLRGQWL